MSESFEYYRPATVEDAVRLLAGTPGARLLAGGTDLAVNIKDGLDSPGAVIDLKHIESLHRLEIDNGMLRIGACVVFNRLIESDIVRANCPLLVEAAMRVGSMGIRNRATLAGNICSAVPSLDSGPALLIYEAVVHVTGPDGTRDISILEWFEGPRKTALKPGEVVTEISVPVPDETSAGCYARLGRYRGEDLAQAGVAVWTRGKTEFRVAFNALAPVALRARKIEHLLNSEPFNEETLSKAQALVESEISPITDIRASREYRMHTAKIMLKRAALTAVERLERRDHWFGHPVI